MMNEIDAAKNETKFFAWNREALLMKEKDFFYRNHLFDESRTKAFSGCPRVN